MDKVQVVKLHAGRIARRDKTAAGFISFIVLIIFGFSSFIVLIIFCFISFIVLIIFPFCLVFAGFFFYRFDIFSFYLLFAFAESIDLKKNAKSHDFNFSLCKRTKFSMNFCFG